MGQNQKKIIAIGGGGFTHKSDEVLDKFVIDQCKNCLLYTSPSPRDE